MRAYDLVFMGGGMSTRVVLYYLLQEPSWHTKKIAVIESNPAIPNKTWSFWEDEKHEWSSIVAHRWKNLRVRDLHKTIEFNLGSWSYQTIRSHDFYEFTDNFFSNFKNVEWILDSVEECSEFENAVEITTKQKKIRANFVLNSIFEKEDLKKIPHTYLLQHFIGWFVETRCPYFDASTIDFMDFSVEQKGNMRFMYVLPFSETEALVEYTLFSEELLPPSEYEEEIKIYLRNKGITELDYNLKDVEKGVIPMTDYPFHIHNTKRILHIGTAGGWTKASSGYTFYFANKYAKKLVEFLHDKNKPLKKFTIHSRFQLYDAVLLKVLKDYNHRGAEIFMKLFKRNSGITILKFLNHQTNFLQEIKIILTSPVRLFLSALIKILNRFISL